MEKRPKNTEILIFANMAHPWCEHTAAYRRLHTAWLTGLCSLRAGDNPKRGWGYITVLFLRSH